MARQDYKFTKHTRLGSRGTRDFHPLGFSAHNTPRATASSWWARCVLQAKIGRLGVCVAVSQLGVFVLGQKSPATFVVCLYKNVILCPGQKLVPRAHCAPPTRSEAEELCVCVSEASEVRLRVLASRRRTRASQATRRGLRGISTRGADGSRIHVYSPPTSLVSVMCFVPVCCNGNYWTGIQEHSTSLHRAPTVANAHEQANARSPTIARMGAARKSLFRTTTHSRLVGARRQCSSRIPTWWWCGLAALP